MYIGLATDSEFIKGNCQENLTSSSRKKRKSYSFTDVSGTNIKAASSPGYQNPEFPFGEIRSTVIISATLRINGF
jgi:hypothetical protein